MAQLSPTSAKKTTEKLFKCAVGYIAHAAVILALVTVGLMLIF